MKALHKFKCPQCDIDVDTHWEDNDDGTTKGILQGPYFLAGDWVLHKECWDKLVEENPILKVT